MKRSLIALAGFTLLGTTAAYADGHCLNATLRGKYVVQASGTIVGVGPVAVVAIFNYDGNGNLTETAYQKLNGNYSQITASGTYAVDDSCVVTDTLLTPAGQSITHTAVIIDHGKKFYILNTTPPTATTGNVTSGVGEKQFPNDLE